MFGKNKKLEKSFTILAPAGKNSVDLVVPFKPKEWLPAFIHDRQHGFPACHPIASDTINAELISYCDHTVFAIRLSWNVAGTRGISLTVRNFLG